MLRMQGLEKSGKYEAVHGVHARFFAATRTCLRFHPRVLHFDWIDRYIVGRSRWITVIKSIAFRLDVQIVRFVFKCPIVWTIHNLRPHENWAAASAERLQRYFARQATLLRVFSKDAIQRASAAFGVSAGKIRVVPEGDHTMVYPNAITRRTARAQLGLADGEFVLLWLGSIRPYKGLHELVEVFRTIAKPNWRLVIAGKPYLPEYANEIAKLVGRDPQITLHARFIPVEEMQVFYNAADVVVLPFAEVENTSSLCVAMGFKKPVVAPSLGVVTERLRHQPELVYNPGDLAKTLGKLESFSQGTLDDIGEANFKEVTSYRVEKFATLFDEIVGVSAP